MPHKNIEQNLSTGNVIWRRSIVDRSRQIETEYAGLHTFEAGERAETHPSDLNEKTLIYCVNAEEQTVLYTTHEDFQNIFQHPFLYMAQFETAQSLIEVPAPLLEQMDSGLKTKPLYIFSIGRCGSTALSKALARAGVPSASEPDLPTQIALHRPQIIESFGEDGIHALVRAMNRSLGIHLGQRFAVKFRSQCNVIVNDILDAQPDVETVFILRRWDAWLRSMHLAFGHLGMDATQLAEGLRDGILAYHELVVRGANPVLIWYEDILEDLGSVLQRLGVTQISEGALLATAEDAQAGTSLARSILAERDTDEVVWREFLAAWATLRPECLNHLPEISTRLGL